jgi:putative Holliday junction resolvase
LDTPDARAHPPTRQGGTVLGFDFGEKRIGVAVGESALGLAHPLATIAEAARDRRFTAIAALVEEWRPALLVVGLPFHADGSEHEMTQRCRRFARSLEGRFCLPVVLVDERLSSLAADRDLRDAGRGGRSGKALRDQAAARIILQDYFDHHRAAS